MIKCPMCDYEYSFATSDATWEPEIFCSRECEILNSNEELKNENQRILERGYS